jgi:hypothetical protein
LTSALCDNLTGASGTFAMFAAIRRAVFSGEYNRRSGAALGTTYKV